MKKKIKNIILFFIIFLLFLIYFFNKLKKLDLFTVNTNNTKLIFNNVGYSCGFFCYFNMIIASLIDNPNTTEIQYNLISKKEQPSTYYVEEYNNLLENIFIPYNENKPITNTIIIDKFIENTEGSKLYFKAKDFYNENRGQFKPFHDAYIKYIKLQPHIIEKIESHKNKLREGNPEKTIGILIRSAANGDLLGRDTVLNKIKELNLNNIKFFFCIDNNIDLDFYKEHLTPNYYLDFKRAETNLGDAPHSDSSLKTLEELENVFIQVAVLSTCDLLLHCNSNMAITSLFMNMNQQSIYIN